MTAHRPDPAPENHVEAQVAAPDDWVKCSTPTCDTMMEDLGAAMQFCPKCVREGATDRFMLRLTPSQLVASRTDASAFVKASDLDTSAFVKMTGTPDLRALAMAATNHPNIPAGSAHRANQAFAAACSPDVVLRLLDRIAELERDLESTKDALRAERDHNLDCVGLAVPLRSALNQIAEIAALGRKP